jgi:uncharacterized protein YidB (DUF937 family)
MTMSKRTKQTAVALTGAVAVAFGAYALGSQSGGGSAGASGNGAGTATAPSSASGAQQAHFGFGRGGDPGRFGPGRFGFRRGGPDAGLAGLAQRLGVSTATLRSALADVRNQLQGNRQDPRDRLAGELASALGLPTAQVTAALQKVLPDRRDPFSPAVLDDLAKQLNLDAAKVRATFDRLRANGRPDGIRQIAAALGVPTAKLRQALRSVLPRRAHVDPFSDTVLNALAKQLNLDAAKVRATFDRLRANGRPDGIPQIAAALGVSRQKLMDALHAALPDRGNKRFGDAFAADLANALNVDVAKIRAALDKVRTEEQARFQQLHDQFVSALAKALNLPEGKVSQALRHP